MMNCPHCNTHVDEHEAGPCLNQWIATDVMGWKKTKRRPAVQLNWVAYPQEWYLTPSGYLINVTNILDFSGSIAVAWEVVEKLNQSGYIVEIINDCVAWSVVFRNIDTDERFTSDWKTSLEVQVCRAAIKATSAT